MRRGSAARATAARPPAGRRRLPRRPPRRRPAGAGAPRASARRPPARLPRGDGRSRSVLRGRRGPFGGGSPGVIVVVAAADQGQAGRANPSLRAGSQHRATADLAVSQGVPVVAHGTFPSVERGRRPPGDGFAKPERTYYDVYGGGANQWFWESSFLHNVDNRGADNLSPLCLSASGVERGEPHPLAPSPSFWMERGDAGRAGFVGAPAGAGAARSLGRPSAPLEPPWSTPGAPLVPPGAPRVPPRAAIPHPVAPLPLPTPPR